MFRILSIRNKLRPSSDFLTPCRFTAISGRESSITVANNPFFTYISESAPTEYVKQLLVSFHDYSGLPWWATIVCSTVIFRTTVTLPFAIYQQHILARIENLKFLEMPEISEMVRRSVAKKKQECQWSDKKANLMYKIMLKKQWNALVVRDNCHPFKATLTIWFQLPAWVFLTVALRNATSMLPFNDAASQILYFQLGVGGLLWIQNLTLPDEFFILPLVLGICNLTIIELQVLRRIQEPTRIQRYVTNFFRFFTLLLVPAAAMAPSAVTLYWTTSSIMGLAQNFLLISNRFRKFCRIPDTPSSLEHPYRQLAYDIKQKLKFSNVSK